MPQVLKDEVKNAIIEGAVAVFARDGFHGATMAVIAKAAGVSTGNVYRYFGSKEELFEAVIDEGFVTRFLALLRSQVEAARGVSDIRTLPHDASHLLASEALISFALAHRLRVVVLLGRAAGSRYETFSDVLVKELSRRAAAHFRELRPGLRIPRPVWLAVEQIYHSLIDATVLVLATFRDECDIRTAITAHTRYHQAGLKALFEGQAAGQKRRS